MPIYKIRGIDVDFPFEAYDCQIVYMEKVIQSLQEGCNALLESPTGTGKTLCLLCATLAWRKSFGKFLTMADQEKVATSGSQKKDGDKSWFSESQYTDEVKSSFPTSQQSGSQSTERPHSEYPVIIYTSRTHSQLQQVIKELRASNYRPKMSILGSREQMCIHDEVRLLRGRAQNNACHYLCKKRLCRHQTKVSDYIKKDHELGNEPFDIEDLVKIGRTKGPCPYYVSRELHKAVDILFAPYNYLIDPGNRRSLSGINWGNAVLIFDEAHNLEGICAEAASFDLPSGYLTACISEAKQCADLCSTRMAIEKSNDKQHDPENYAILRALLLKLEKRVAELTIGSREMGYTRPGHYIYDFLSDLNITFETANMLIDTIENAAILLEEGDTTGNGTPVKSVKTKGTVCRLENIKDILNIIFRDGGKDHAKYYRFHVQEHQPSISDSTKGKLSRTLSWWCFNPGLAMQEFMKLGVRSVILTSGTLSPLDSFALELNLEFPVRLENPHVISPNQVWVGVVPSGPSGYSFNSSYRTRDSLEYKQGLGNAIVNFARIVPDGLLVFFPSYYLMDQCIDCWKSMSHAGSSNFSTIWDRICKNKQPVVEPKQSALFPHAIEDFEAKLRDKATSGAIFFAVCRGKVSEGLDFTDQAGRAVVITGMPFSMKTDAKVRLKREYLDQQALAQKKDAKTLPVLTGEEWYVQQAARAVNQAVGRVIRHRHDYGAIILCDERFGQQSLQCQMSYWIRPYIKCYPKFGDVVFTLTRFFRDKANCSVKSKLIENVIVEKSGLTQEKVLPSKGLSSLASTSIVADAGRSRRDLLRKVLPANHSNLSNENNFSLSTLCSPDELCSRSRLRTCERNKVDDKLQNTEVIDLTGDMRSYGKTRAGEAMAPFFVKRSKSTNIGSDAAKCHEYALPPKFSISSSSDIGYEQISRVPSREPADILKSHENREAQAGSVMISKGETILEKPFSEQTLRNKEDRSHGNAVIKGSSFLAQVNEKLSGEEYKEFVGYMKALKSKAMKITFVLESIAKLFSTPGRFILLKGFKDFVPAKYHPIYEQYLRAHDTADGTRADT